MRVLLHAFVALAAASTLHASAEWIEQGDSFERQFKSAEALAAYQKALAGKPDDPVILRKIAKQYVELALDAPGKAEKLRLAQQGYDTALKAKKLDPNNPEGRLTVAVAAARLGFYSDAKTKLELSKVVKQEASEAIRLKPGYALGWHMLGRWNYEIASLNPLLKKLAEVIYGKMPSASYDEAVRCLGKAAQLEPNNALFQAELGRGYLALDKKDEARRGLEKSLTLPRRTKDDGEAQTRAKAALREL
jgi:tetratricopeptide (TPR) repeat protein